MANNKATTSNKNNKSSKTAKKGKKIIFGIVAAVVVVAIAVVTAITLLGGGNGSSLFGKRPALKDGRYCEVTGSFYNLARTIVYNDYFCIEVTNKKTYTEVTISDRPAALKFKETHVAKYKFDFGDPIEIKGKDDDENEDIYTIEQIDDETLLMKNTDGSFKREVSTSVEEDLENQADKE